MSEDSDELQKSLDLHRVLHSAYSFVRGMATNSSIASLTLDHLLEEHIRALKMGEKRVMSDAGGTGFDSRPSRWDQIDEVEQKFLEVIGAIEKAGNDPDKLRSLGIYEASQGSKESP